VLANPFGGTNPEDHTSGDPTLTWGAAVRNASDLPVYQVYLEYVPIRRGGGVLAVVLELVPPGDWLLSGREPYRRSFDRTLPSPREASGPPDRPFVVELRFTDAANRTWHRDRQGILTLVET
jgi:hypothetical protein